MKKFRNVLAVIIAICVVFMGAYSIYFRFQNPELTTTQLIVKLWKLYAIEIIFIVIFYVVKGISNEE